MERKLFYCAKYKYPFKCLLLSFKCFRNVVCESNVLHSNNAIAYNPYLFKDINIVFMYFCL